MSVECHDEMRSVIIKPSVSFMLLSDYVIKSNQRKEEEKKEGKIEKICKPIEPMVIMRINER